MKLRSIPSSSPGLGPLLVPVLGFLLGSLACGGGPPEVGYGPGKDEVVAHAAAAAASPQGGAPAVDQAAAGEKGALPHAPSPSIRYAPPYDGQPIASRVDPSGVQIDDFVAGEGPEATKGASVVVHYTGYLTDGTVFDSSLDRGRPFPFELGAGRVIKGWDAGVVGMRAGGKRRLVIPAELAYGARAAGKIPPNSTLIFTIELVSMTPPQPPPQPLSAYTGAPVKVDRPSNGLVISDFKLGDGAEAKAGDEVQVHYHGTLEDGTVFDSSHTRRPIAFVLGTGRVIKGWDQGIAGMKVGGLRKLEIPAELAYGARARGKIPANAPLTFLVELMEAKPAAAPPPRPTLGVKPVSGSGATGAAAGKPAPAGAGSTPPRSAPAAGSPRGAGASAPKNSGSGTTKPAKSGVVDPKSAPGSAPIQ